ncbi:hypothetical protein [Microbacterium sp. Se63.02b]|uniref:hypothetical protein n=1 Tax=Microbacterium sp. Se63.02b TaxID=2709304 RepID=UPI001FCF0281|nr:hypothetical protein [Microbacterium sp. Se63.02b]
MAAHVLRLRFALLLGSLRGDRRVRTLLAFAAVVIVTVVVCLAVFSLADASVPVARAVTVLGGGALLLGFLVGPILVGAVDQLDPRRFAVFGVDERQMPWVLVLAAFVSVPSLALLAVYVSVCVVAVSAGTPWPLAVLFTVVGVVTTVLIARIGMAINALLLPERRSRELTALFALALLVIAFPVAVFLGSLRWDGHVPESLATLSTVLGFTPFAAAPGFLFSAAAGRPDRHGRAVSSRSSPSVSSGWCGPGWSAASSRPPNVRSPRESAPDSAGSVFCRRTRSGRSHPGASCTGFAIADTS